jgi:hypothetical protein
MLSSSSELLRGSCFGIKVPWKLQLYWESTVPKTCKSKCSGEDKMRSKPILIWLYLLNAAVIITHEIDSAYWHEWELFGIPGDIQVFLCLNLPIIILILYGLQALAIGHPSGLVLSQVLVAGGFFAVTIHTYFLLQGNAAFRLPTSVALLAAIAVLSLVQTITLLSKQS